METLKVVLAMLALVLIGFIGGFATHRHLAKERIQDIARMHRASGFAEQLGRTIRPTEEQRQIIRPIFKEWATEMQEVRAAHNLTKIAQVDMLLERIRPHLEAAQIERLEQRLERYQDRLMNRSRSPKIRE